MISFTSLQHALLDAVARLETAQRADEANPYLDHTKHYSHAYLEAYWHWQNIYYQWREVYEAICFPLTAIGVLYDPTLDLLYHEEDVPTVKMAAIKLGTVKLPVVEFPRIAA